MEYFFRHDKRLRIIAASLPRRTYLQRLKNRLGNYYFKFFGKYSYDEHRAIRLLTQRIEDGIDLNDFDVVLLFYLAHDTFISYLNRKKGKSKIVIDTVDVQSDRMGKLLALRSKAAVFRRAVYLKRMEESEKKALKWADGLVALSREDQRYFEEDLHCKSVFYCPTGIEMPKLQNDQTIVGNNVLFYGAMNSIANARAASYFKHEVFPKVRRRFPDAKFLIVGSNPLPEVIALQDSNTIVTGYVENVAEYFQNTKCFVCPFQVSYGERTRIYEVMGFGIPCVVTTSAVKGMGLEHVGGIITEDDPVRFGEQVVRIMESEVLRRRLGTSVRKWAEDHVSIEQTYGKLVSYLESISS
ncbi:MAG: glycosyltransferase [Bacteroidota bacterium]